MVAIDVNSRCGDSRRRRAFAGIVLATACALTGCGDGLASLTGTVTIDGQPAPKGLALEFTPLGRGSSSYATTDASGRYEAAFTFRKMGIEPGEHRVRLLPSQVEAPMPVIGPDGQPVARRDRGPSPGKLRREYYEQIETLTVTPGRNEHDIALTSGAE